MNALNLAENIIRLRHDKKITQEQLADFVGVKVLLEFSKRTFLVQ